MKNKAKSEKTQRISDEAVQAKTGQNWQEWFAILDAASAKDMTHSQIAQFLYEKQGVPRWWSQMVANAYEQDRGNREKHQMPEGYQISVTKTVGVPIDALYQSWSDDQTRSRWLPGEAITIRKEAQQKSIRITWSDARTNVDVNFYRKGESKSQVVVQHSKLADSTQAEQMKGYWKEALARLRRML